MKGEPTDNNQATRDLLGSEVAERLERRNRNFPAWGSWSNDVVFGDLWQREGLDKGQRSLITTAVLAATGRERELMIHIGVAINNGVTLNELAEGFQQVGFYAGWPAGGSALNVLTAYAEAHGLSF